MTQEDKELLLKYLSARLPYGVIVEYRSREKEGNVKITCGNIGYVTELGNGWWKECKPYLRPMASMTEEEKRELKAATCPKGTGYFDEQHLICPMSHFGEHIGYDFMSDILNWLNKHHFDYRGLIERGLAIEVTEDNNPYKD